MLTEFNEQEILISKVYYYPHHPDFTEDCDCRKPKPGMLHQAKKSLILIWLTHKTSALIRKL